MSWNSGLISFLLLSVIIVSIIITSSSIFINDMTTRYNTDTVNDTVNTTSPMNKLNALALDVKNSTSESATTNIEGFPLTITTGALTGLQLMASSVDIVIDLLDNTIELIPGFPFSIRLLLESLLVTAVVIFIASAILRWDL